MPEPFLAILTHSPSEVACRSSRKASHASREAKGKIGRSGLAAMASPSDDRCRRATKRRSVSSERPIPSLAVGPERPCQQFTRLFADSQVASAPFGHGREGTSGFLRGWSSTRHGCRLRAEHAPTTRGRHTLESERGSGAAGLELRGGCQCGSIHYRALVEDDEAYYCHCRMCQKAFGNLFGAFFFALEDTVEWEAGSLAYYRSSKIAPRFLPGVWHAALLRRCGIRRDPPDGRQPRRAGTPASGGALRLRGPRGSLLHRRRAAQVEHGGRRRVRGAVEGRPRAGLDAWTAGRSDRQALTGGILHDPACEVAFCADSVGSYRQRGRPAGV